MRLGGQRLGLRVSTWTMRPFNTDIYYLCYLGAIDSGSETVTERLLTSFTVFSLLCLPSPWVSSSPPPASWQHVHSEQALALTFLLSSRTCILPSATQLFVVKKHNSKSSLKMSSSHSPPLSFHQRFLCPHCLFSVYPEKLSIIFIFFLLTKQAFNVCGMNYWMNESHHESHFFIMQVHNNPPFSLQIQFYIKDTQNPSP